MNNINYQHSSTIMKSQHCTMLPLFAVYDFVIKLHFLSKPCVLPVTLAILPAVLTLLFVINNPTFGHVLVYV